MKPLKQQWLVLKHESSVDSALRSFEFSTHRNPGFELIEIKGDQIFARFIEKIESIERISSPFGINEEIPSIRYVHFEFSITPFKKGASLINIFKPPASIRSFVDALALSLDYGAYFEKIYFNLNEVFQVVEEDPRIDRLITSKVCASQIPLGNESVAKIEISSRSNALFELRERYQNPEIKLDRMVLEARMNSQDEHMELSSAGSIFCTPGFDKILKEFVLNKLKN